MQLVRYNEPLEAEELSFLKKKEQKERGQYYKLIKWLMIFSFLCPFVIAWLQAMEGMENPFSVQVIFCWSVLPHVFLRRRDLFCLLF